MSENECTNATCPLHNRVDGVRTYDDGEGMAAKVTYVGNHAVITKANQSLEYPQAMVLRMMGADADIFYTQVILVGEKSLGEALADDKFEGYEPVKFMESHTTRGGDLDLAGLTLAEKDAENYHDGIVSALKAETLSLSEGFTRQEYIDVLFNSLKPIEGLEGLEGLSDLGF